MRQPETGSHWTDSTILLQRGDPSGEYLLRRAIAHADRIGYQLQVERANKILLRYKSTARRH
jgi:hypothetical protein